MSDTSDRTATSEPPASLVAALRQLLAPLVRLLLARHVAYPFLSNLLKEIYVEVAERELANETERASDSRVSVLTGVHRKDVRRLRGRTGPPAEVPRAVSLGGRVVARWLRDHVGAEGRARPLPRQAAEPGEPSFAELVASVSTDVRPRTLLDEWLRLGVAHLDQDDRVCLDADAFVPGKGFDEKAFYFGRGLRDHVAAGAHNLLGESPAFFDRSVHYGGLSPDSVRELAALAERLGTRSLEEVNRRALELREAEGAGADDAAVATARRRMRFGIFFFEDESGGSDA